MKKRSELRSANIQQSILITGFTPPARYELAIQNDLSITIWDQEQLNLASDASQKLTKSAKVHMKVDTGMSRLGVQFDESVQFAQQIASCPFVEFEGLFTHFAKGTDETDPKPTEKQNILFKNLIDQIRGAGIKQIIHAANSAAGITHPGSICPALVRSGILIYGLNPPTIAQPLRR